jgi:hypothetical protein
LLEGGDGTDVGAHDRDEDDRLECEPYSLRGDHGSVPLDRARVLKVLQPAMAGRQAQADVGCEVGDAHAPVILKR